MSEPITYWKWARDGMVVAACPEIQDGLYIIRERYDALRAKVREYHEKYVHQDLLFAEQDKVRELEEALRAVSSVGRNILKPKFDHCGFMNATQLGNRDAVLHMLKQVERALEGKEEHGTRRDG